jgi:1,2-diacylglycerol 3-beta-glucosyltransferase
VAGALELFLVTVGLGYFLATTGNGLRVLRASRITAGRGAPAGRRPAARHRSAPRTAGPRGAFSRWGRRVHRGLVTADEPRARGQAGPAVDPADAVVYFLVPCLNEELVIEATLRNLLADARARVVVVDDASDDRTGELSAAVDRARVMVVRRELPEARQGKGPALNAGLACILADAAARGIAATRITVCVMDADGRLSAGAVDAVLPLFGDERVGGVQLPVRIRNRGSLLTILQDVEFWGVCAVAQLGRIRSGSVSLGGNGQFTRLTALLEIGARPWAAELTEDLDLALAFAAAGWRLTSTPLAHVSQQGVESLRALIRQRTRWYQGHMHAARWLPTLWSSRKLSHLGMLEITMYLLVPWLLVLPWSVAFNYNLLVMILAVAGWGSLPAMGSGIAEHAVTLLLWYSLTCLPIWIAGYLYCRQDGKISFGRAFLFGHLLLIGNYVTFVSCWRAFYRLIVGATRWQKTARHVERPAAAALPALASLVPAPRAAGAADPAARSHPSGGHRAGRPPGGSHRGQPGRRGLGQPVAAATAVPGGPPAMLTSVAAPFRPAEKSLIESGQIWA